MEFYSAVVTMATAAVMSYIAVLLPALGEGVSERSGVMNIGVEGYMIMGSLTAYIWYAATGNMWMGFVLGTLAGMSLSLAHAVFCITLKCNQVISIFIQVSGSGNDYGKTSCNAYPPSEGHPFFRSSPVST